LGRLEQELLHERLDQKQEQELLPERFDRKQLKGTGPLDSRAEQYDL
jgi:hypothetical protein